MGHKVRDVKDAPLHLLQQLSQVVVVEGQGADEQRVQDHSRGPDVRSPAVVLLAPDHFGTGVVGRSTGRLQHGAVDLQAGHAKVRYLNVVLVIQQQVFRLKIPVTDGVFVAEVQCRDDLTEEPAGFFRR